MKPIKSLLVLVLVCAPALAAAQGYQGGPGSRSSSGPRFHHREGRLAFGFGLGLGRMSDDLGDIGCPSCRHDPLSFEGDVHIGGMLSSRLALMFEGQLNSQQIDSSVLGGDTFLSQGAAMAAVQVWLLPQLWLKGGLGFTRLSVDDEFASDDLGGGIAVMGAVGFEVFSARNLALDLQLRVLDGVYDGGDYHVTGGTVGVGLSWY